MEGLIYALVVMSLLCASALVYEHYNVKKILREIYVGRMVGFFEDGYIMNGAVLSYNKDEIIILTMEGIYKTTPTNIYFVD